MLPTRATVVAMCVTAAGAACSSSTPPSNAPPSGTLSPSGLTVVQDTANSLILRWTPPTAPFDSYTLEVSDVVHPFQQIGDPFPASSTGLRLTTQNPIPELVHLYFRLTAISGQKPLGPAATADFIEPLRALDATATYVDGGIVVTWLARRRRTRWRSAGSASGSRTDRGARRRR